MSNRQDRPLAKKLLHALGLLALALFLLYVAVQFVLIFHRSYKTETAIRYTLAESLNLTGVVAFDAVDVPGSGNLGYLVQDGERVTNGTVVAECYTDDTQGLQRERLDRLERSITLLTKSQNSAGSELSPHCICTFSPRRRSDFAPPAKIAQKMQCILGQASKKTVVFASFAMLY